MILERIIKAPFHDVCNALNVDSSEAIKRLEDNGIAVDGAVKLEDLWINNNADPEVVFDIIME